LKRSKQILLVISKFPPEYSGPGVRIPRLYDWLNSKSEEYALRVLCNGIEKNRGERYSYKGYPVHRIVAGWAHSCFSFLPKFPSKYKHAIIYQLEFLQTLFSLFTVKDYAEIDLVHVAGHSGGTAAALVWAKIKNVPVLMELVTSKAPYQQSYLFVFKTPVSDKFKVVTLTDDMQQKCLKAGLSSLKLWCRPNPIDEIRFTYPSREQKNKFREVLTPFSDDQIVLVSVAKMMPQKNQKLIVDTLKYLPEKFVALIGGPVIQCGPLKDRDLAYVEEITTLIKAQNLSNRVHFVADFVDAEEYMKAGDIYMMPAWNEGLGTPMLESMACGLPVVGNQNEPAFQEWIKNGDNGFLCDISSPQEWANAIEKLENFSEEERLKLSQTIHKSAGQRGIYSQYERIINKLMTEV